MIVPSPSVIYLDNNATTPVLSEVKQALLEALGKPMGNASSSHSFGKESRKQIGIARARVAELVGVSPEYIIFNSGATEGNNTIITSAAIRCDFKGHIVTSKTEHSSILAPCRSIESKGISVTYLPVNSHGLVDLDELDRATTPDTQLVSIQWANSETGVLQPIAEIGRLCRRKGIPFHSDAAQAVGKLPIDLGAVPVDFITMSAHKWHGPQGIGAIYARNLDAVVPMIRGGDQEQGVRAGTENVPGIIATGVAAQLRSCNLSDDIAAMRQLRDRFEGQLLKSVADASVNGVGADRIGNCSNIRLGLVEGQAIVARLDQKGLICSQSSACTNQRPEPSYVLRAMGLTEDESYASVRFCFSVLNTMEEADVASEMTATLCEQLKMFAT